MNTIRTPTGALTTENTITTLTNARPNEQRFVNAELLTIAGVFLTFGILTMGGLIATADTVTSQTVGYLMLAILAAAFIGVAIKLVPRTTVVAAAIATSLGSIIISVQDVGGVIYPLATQWILLAASTTGLLITSRRGWKLIAATAAAAFVTMLICADTLTSAITVVAAVIVIDATAIAMGNYTAARAWTKAAARRDTGRNLALTTTADAINAHTRRQALQHHFAVIHDTCLNTLSAILLTRTLPDHHIQEAAAADITAIDTIGTEHPGAYEADGLRAALLAETRHARLRDATVTVTVTDATDTIPAHAIGALLSCVAATLERTNTTDITVTVTTAITVTITGHHLAPDDAAHELADNLGITITYTPTNPPTTTLTWAPDKTAHTNANTYTTLMNETIAVMVRRVVGWTGLGLIAEIAISNPGTIDYGWTLLPLAATAALILAAVLPTNPYPLKRLLVWAAIPLVAIDVLSSLTHINGECHDTGGTFINSSAAIIALVAIILLTNSRTLTAFAIASYVISNGYVVTYMLTATEGCGDLAASNYITDLSAIAVMVILRRNVARFTVTLQASNTATAHAISAELFDNGATHTVVTSTRRTLAPTRALLTGISAGTTNWRESDTQTAIAREVRRLRNIINLPSGDIALYTALADAITTASAHGTRIHVTTIPTNTHQSDQVTAAAIGAATQAALTSIPTPLSATVTITGDTITVTADDPGHRWPPRSTDDIHTSVSNNQTSSTLTISAAHHSTAERHTTPTT